MKAAVSFLAALGGLGVLAGPPENILPPDLPRSFQLQAPDDSYATVSLVSSPGLPFPEFGRMIIHKRAEHPRDLQVRAAIIQPVRAGDVLLADIWFRREGASPDNEGFLGVVFASTEPDYEKSAAWTFTDTTGEWRRWRLPFQAAADYPAGGARLNLQLGFAPGTVEIGAVTLTNYADTVSLDSLPNDATWEGREADAPWRAAAAERIENLRKADLLVRVRDAAGRPLPGAEVSVEMRRHAFDFGAAVDADLILDPSPEAARYRGVVTQWFNTTVLKNALKWPRWERDPASARNSVAWLGDHGLTVRGHNLIWPKANFLPNDLKDLIDDPPALRARIDAHITEEATAFAGQLRDWDVVNEPFTAHDVMDLLGWGEVPRWFALARAADPTARLFVNDFDNLEDVGFPTPHQVGYHDIIDGLIQAGAPLDGIGLQSHFQEYLTPPERLLQVLDYYAAFGRRLLVTEFDVDQRDETLQADYTRDFLTVMFSHPAVDGVLAWGFWEGRHWRPRAAMFRQDWSLRPNGVVWTNLVFQTWWTRAQAATDDQGEASFRPFKGRHAVTVRLEETVWTDEIELPPTAELEVTLDVTAPPPPRLRAVLEKGRLRLFWPASDGPVEQVQFTPHVSPAHWVGLTVVPERSGDEWMAEISPNEAAGFYRLVRPARFTR